jgi:hypothetical protein
VRICRPVSYPLAAFVFGAIMSVVHSLLKAGFGLSYEFAKGGFAPVRAGLDLALGGLWPLWPFATSLCLSQFGRHTQLKTVLDSKTATRALPNNRLQPSARETIMRRRG